MFELHKDATYPFPHLVIDTVDGEKFVALTKAEFWTIGRGYNNSIVLNDKWASRNHATIQLVGKAIEPPIDRHIQPIAENNDSYANPNLEQTSSLAEPKSHTNNLPDSEQESAGNFYLVDLGSRNGSFVNGHRLIAPVAIKHSDRLILGKTEMVFYNPNQQIVPPIISPDRFDTPTAPNANFGLTPSEEKVFRQVVQGLTNKEIGKRLQISPRTVQTHLSSIMTKLNLDNRSQIVRFAFERGYYPLDATEST
ncbi:LuxR C-terminal-related transcriptional regulator [Pseudanabaena sp. PCC 6802]|uniref:LuxR C-terminal-related transcriptional regulator n=1 Tax=Pseudanabaena sp. PCC 6802 TaxID=118173 RepID=UPI00034B0BCB|nr:LuxR C-terminal-related transcriptional regulator [Pseudanabaena sp. PCC 6802]